MSAEHAKKFVDLVSSDPQLQEEVKKAQGSLVDLSAQKGFTLTEEELHDELRARWGTGTSEEGTELIGCACWPY